LNVAFHHVGVVTPDLPGCATIYRRLGYEAGEAVADPIQGVSIVLCRRASHPLVELIAPTNRASPASAWLKRIKAGPYHTCYETPDLRRTISELESIGYLALAEPVPAVAFEGRLVVFLWSGSAGLVELLDATR
jgi:methylmalonyl-CoA/ethylmalonyl-CoA epimerase